MQSSCSLTGTVPQLSPLQQLVSFHVANNRLGGTLPADWLSTTSLRFFDAGFNQLTGTIPPPLASTDLIGPNQEIGVVMSNNQVNGARWALVWLGLRLLGPPKPADHHGWVS